MTDQKRADLKLAAEAIEQLYHTISDTEVTVAPDQEREFIHRKCKWCDIPGECRVRERESNGAVCCQ